jgi:hypothetical protein
MDLLDKLFVVEGIEIKIASVAHGALQFQTKSINEQVNPPRPCTTKPCRKATVETSPLAR